MGRLYLNISLMIQRPEVVKNLTFKLVKNISPIQKIMINYIVQETQKMPM